MGLTTEQALKLKEEGKYNGNVKAGTKTVGEILFDNKWPEYDKAKMVDDEVKVAVQINGKTKTVIEVAADISKDDVIAKAKEALGDKLSGNIIKEIYVPKKIVNLVAK